MKKAKSKIILGLVGEIAAGKDTVAAYLAKHYHSETISFSQPLREICDLLLLEQSRQNMVWLGHDLRQRFGGDILARAITKQVAESSAKMICLPNVRLDLDIKYLKKMPGFVLAGITADEKTRFKRLKTRGQNTDDKTKTWSQFKKDALLPTEASIRKIINTAKYQLDNNGSLKDLYTQVDKIIKDLK